MRVSVILLRTAAGLAFVQGLAHGCAIATYVPHHGPAELATISAMRTQFFHFGGPWDHNYWELYTGYGWLAAVQCIVEAAALWIAAAWSYKVNIVPLVWLFIAANLVHAAVVLRFFFLMPLYADLIVTSCLFGFLVQWRRQTEGNSSAITTLSQ